MTEDLYSGKRFWDSATEAENIALLSRVAKLKSKGIDVEGLFKMVEPQGKAGQHEAAITK